MDITIRREEESDFRTVEEITRRAFWNLYVPGANEHLIVHKLRMSDVFVPELSFVAETAGTIVGNIVFTRSCINDTNGVSHPTITFGPVSVLPEFQHQGIGATLIRYALDAARKQGHSVVIIYGYPDYYRRYGFRPGKDFGVTDCEGKYPAAMLALELCPGALQGVTGMFVQTDLFETCPEELDAFDKEFPPLEKRETGSQKEFATMAISYL